jgi:hypothetical protein
MKVNWLIYEQPLKALVKFVMKTISFVFFMGLAFAGMCAVGLLFCSVIGMWALAVSQTTIWWFPVIALGGIITSVCLFKYMKNTAMSAFCAIILGIIWPVTVAGMLIWITVFSIGAGIDRLKNWCGYYER